MANFTRILLCHSFNFNPCRANIPIYLVPSSTLPAFTAEYTKQRNTGSKSTIETLEKVVEICSLFNNVALASLLLTFKRISHLFPVFLWLIFFSFFLNLKR